MQLERVSNSKHAMYEKALQLYRASFPLHECREIASQERILGDREYNFCLLYEDGVFLGLVLYWETDAFIYVEHLCILPALRNRQYGHKALEQLKAKGKTVILEIDPPVDEISLRREKFYTRCAFLKNPFTHVHPPYHPGNAGHGLVVMSAPDRLTQAEYADFYRYLACRVMADAY